MSDQTTMPEHRIVVGVDGSTGSKVALEWAINQARMTGAKLEAVASWQDPALNGYAMGYAYVPYGGDDQATITQKVLDETIAEVSEKMKRPVHVDTRVMEGHPAQILSRAGANASLLVVGSRGYGAFAGLLLGSVSQHCVQHSSCPVVVVPQPEPRLADTTQTQ